MSAGNVREMNLFADPLHDQFASWATAWMTSGGADYGEIVAIADAFPEGGDDADFFDAWSRAGDRHLERADEALGSGHTETAQGHLLRAAALYAVAIKPWFGTPVDRRMSEGFAKLTDAFEQAIVLGRRPGERITVPFEDYELPTWFLPATDSEPGEARPVVIAVNGYDGTLPDMYFGIGKSAAERGYHVVMFDGPGQGALLVNQSIPMIPEWDRVVSAVIDSIENRQDVDRGRIAVHGWSLGGHLAPRAAAGESRIAAVIADPALWGILDGMRGLVAAFGSDELAAALPDLPDDAATAITAKITGDRGLEWRIVKRGFWVHGVDDLQSYIRAVAPFTMTGHIGDIRCPLLGTTTEGDVLAAGAGDFLSKADVPTTLLEFTAAEGAAGHCEFQNRWLLNTRVLDWLDETLA